VREELAGRAPASVSRDLTLLYSIFRWAVVNELRESNPAEGLGRPLVRQRKGHDLSPSQVQALLRSFDDAQARAAFLTMVLTGIRRSELQAMRWRDLDLIENRLSNPDSKSDSGVRVVAVPAPLAEELWQQRRRSNFQGEDERVFCHPELGCEYHIATKYRPALERASQRAGLPWPQGLRPCHDLRVTAITTDARTGTDPIAIMANAGHASYSTTKRYVKLAGVIFPDAAEARAQRLLSTEPSTDLSRPESIEGRPGAPGEAVSSALDAA
jgi:integrase